MSPMEYQTKVSRAEALDILKKGDIFPSRFTAHRDGDFTAEYDLEGKWGYAKPMITNLIEKSDSRIFIHSAEYQARTSPEGKPVLVVKFMFVAPDPEDTSLKVEEAGLDLSAQDQFTTTRIEVGFASNQLSMLELDLSRNYDPQPDDPDLDPDQPGSEFVVDNAYEYEPGDRVHSRDDQWGTVISHFNRNTLKVVWDGVEYSRQVKAPAHLKENLEGLITTLTTSLKDQSHLELGQVVILSVDEEQGILVLGFHGDEVGKIFIGFVADYLLEKYQIALENIGQGSDHVIFKLISDPRGYREGLITLVAQMDNAVAEVAYQVNALAQQIRSLINDLLGIERKLLKTEMVMNLGAIKTETGDLELLELLDVARGHLKTTQEKYDLARNRVSGYREMVQLHLKNRK